MPKLSKRRILMQSLRLKCPRCGKGDICAGMFKMNLDCSNCRFKFEREPGYFVGAMYINYGSTVLSHLAAISRWITWLPSPFSKTSFCGLFSAASSLPSSSVILVAYG